MATSSQQKLGLRGRFTALFTGRVPAPEVYPNAGLSLAIGATGAVFSADLALKIGAVWRAVNLIASTVGKLPLIVYRREGDGKVPAIESPLFQLLRYAATPEVSQLDFRQTLTGHVLLTGNAYSYIVRDPVTFEPVELWPLAPGLTCAVRETDVTTGQSQTFYTTR